MTVGISVLESVDTLYRACDFSLARPRRTGLRLFKQGDDFMVKTIQFLGAVALALGLSFSAQAQTGDFDSANMRCLEYINGQGDGSTNKAKADIARIWIMGYMAGNYTGRDKLKWSDDSKAEGKVVSAVLSKCRENPEVTLLTVAEYVASARKRALPSTLSNDFNPQTYMCGDHADGKKGSASELRKADIAEVWAFAFVQGFVNTDDPDLLIPVENKPAITGAVSSNCAKNREYSFYDLTAAVAPMVTPK